MKNGRNIYVIVLDFKNVFGSVPQYMLINYLLKKGFNNEFIQIVRNVNTGSATRIIMNNFAPDEIDIKRGTKQGCSVSLLLFNLCLKPLFHAIVNVNHDNSYWINSMRDDARLTYLCMKTIFY